MSGINPVKEKESQLGNLASIAKTAYDMKKDSGGASDNKNLVAPTPPTPPQQPTQPDLSSGQASAAVAANSMGAINRRMMGYV